MPPLVEIDVLGPLRVTVEGVAIDVRPRSARTLLAWLASQHGRRLRPEACARVLHRQMPPGAGARKVSDAARVLRGLLPDVFEPGTALSLAETQVAIDEHRFRAELARALRPGVPAAAAETSLETALGLWRGIPYPDLETVVELATSIQDLVEMHARAQDSFTAARLRGAPDYRIVGELRDRLARDPGRERTWRQLSVALYLTSRQAEALAVLGECRAALAGRGLAPTDALDDLHLAILRSEMTGLYLMI